jgi:hypothetical protein
VTDKSPQSVEADAEPGLDLEQELNALLGQIESANAAEAPADADAPTSDGTNRRPSSNPDADDADELDRQIDRVIAGNGAPETGEASPGDSASADSGGGDEPDVGLDGDFETAEQAISQSDDPLADQIQELLDEAKAKSPPEAPADDAPHEPDAAPEGSDGPAINELDQMLAAGADDAVSGEFESFDEVMGADPPSADKERPTAAPEAGDAPDLAIDAEDAFASPEQVLEEEQPTPATKRSASIDDAAREPAAPPEPVAAAQPPAAHQTEEQNEDAKPVRDWKPLIEVNAQRLRRACATVNRPLGQFPPEVRNTIGYVGLATLANAAVLILYGLVF